MIKQNSLFCAKSNVLIFFFLMKGTIDYYACTVLILLLVALLIVVLLIILIVLDCAMVFRESPVVKLLVCGRSGGGGVGSSVGQKGKRKSPDVTLFG